MLLAGCAGSKVKGPRTDNPDRVTHNDFVDMNASDNAQHSQQAQPPIPTEPPAIREVSTGDGITLTAAQPSQPSTTVSPTLSSQPPTSGPLSLLDAKVGDVNGKPIFTNSFFASIEDRLIAEASRLPPRQWRQSAGKTIAGRLDGIIADELLRAEALTALTPTQRVGLQAFLSNFRSNLLSENLGSSQLASRRLQEQQGKSLDEALRQKEIDTLVQLTLIQEVNRRVNVSWRDIKQRYERDIDVYSPPPTAVLRVIRTLKNNAEKVADIQSQLDGGTDFIKIAAGTLNNYNPNTDGMLMVLIEDTYQTTEFFGPADVLNTATQSLAIGELAGPIELGSSVYWIKLMDIKQESISLYDAQLKIQQELTFERRKEARDNYLEKLMERARVSSRDEVLMRLLEIAEQRYGPKG